MIFECRMKKILFFLFTCALTIGSMQAQEAADSIKIYYRRGYRNIDPSFRDNRSQLECFLNSIDATLKNDRVEKIVIRSYASPDGVDHLLRTDLIDKAGLRNRHNRHDVRGRQPQSRIQTCQEPLFHR